MKHICDTFQRFAAPQITTAIAGKYEMGDGCWNWIKKIDRKGYGRVSFRVGRRRREMGAHKASWIAHRGPVPNGLVIDHLCRNRRCVNPDHLDVVTSGENTRRSPLMVKGVVAGRPTQPLEKRRGCRVHGTTDGRWEHRKNGYAAWVCSPCRRVYQEKRRGAQPGKPPAFCA